MLGRGAPPHNQVGLLGRGFGEVECGIDAFGQTKSVGRGADAACAATVWTGGLGEPGEQLVAGDAFAVAWSGFGKARQQQHVVRAAASGETEDKAVAGLGPPDQILPRGGDGDAAGIAISQHLNIGGPRTAQGFGHVLGIGDHAVERPGMLVIVDADNESKTGGPAPRPLDSKKRREKQVPHVSRALSF